MFASRILPLARTSRWAIVGSGTRKARAISAVVRPPNSRSVSATRALGASAGWQHVKIRRRRSSGTAPSSTGGSSRACSSAACAWRSSREASRRRRSIARLRAVVMIQPAGLGGSPLAGQRPTAVANASWTASSATSMSPKTPTRTATARPYCSRKTRSISGAPIAGTRASVVAAALERPHLDRQPDRARRLAAPVERRVEVARAYDQAASDVLLALGVGPVGGQQLAVARAHDGGRAGRVQAAVEDPGAGRFDLVDERIDVAHDLIEHLGRGRVPVGLVDAQQVVLHRASWSPGGRPGAGLPSSTRTGGGEIDSG